MKAGTATTTFQPRGRDRRETILEAARQLMSEEGAGAVTVRGVARAAGIAPGHLGYYFPTLDALMDALLDWVIDGYLRVFDELRSRNAEEPVAGLRAVLDYVLDDLARQETTRFFPQLWVLANHDERAREQMRTLYDKYLRVLEELIAAIRPDLPAVRVSELALFICASIEGQTVFIGHERAYREHREALHTMAVDSLIATVQGMPG